ncbi:amidase [Rhizobiaceae bacterium BDR2-2]|uniref:Indoleacetamide hydrolase n=1 Tax=Ectorhizobium quercum TaxID=2965071 RepID=A0AAE3N1F5_9HYPH|nr:amidase [Ectorhizobium quercum]MCX8998411.1 amidase [Ectorhizobium quercum]
MGNTGNLGKSVAQLSVLLQAGALDPRELAEETLAAIAAHPDRAIFTLLTPERARREAEASARRIAEGRSLGVLDGVPVAWKDLFDLEGVVTTAGSKVLARNAPAEADAAVVQALEAAGMVAVGRTNMSEFAFSGIGINPHYGTPQNPAATDGPRIPGGSSSGAGVAVAAGLVPVAIGTDTGGSIRIPAAFNGVVGYKATRGRYPMDGVFPLAKSLDSLGPLCRTVQDAVWVDAAMRGQTASEVKRATVDGQSLVVPETVVFDGIEAGVAAAFEAALERLAAAGARIRRQAFPVFAELFELIAERGALVTAEAYALHRERLAGAEAADMDPRVVSRTRGGEKITAPDYIHILETRERMIADMARALAPGELLVSPTLPHVAPAIGPLLTDDERFFTANARTLRNTQIGNFLDGCGVSIPCGTGDAGMPAGCLLSGLPHADERLLAVALAAEETVRG